MNDQGPDKGAYLLVLRLQRGQEIEVGSLGRQWFRMGTYVYAGSALNSLRHRVSRHFSLEKRMRWHIDFLRARATPVEALLLRGEQNMECLLNEMAASVEGSAPWCPGFGCSDCRCSTHLHLLDRGSLRHLEEFIVEMCRPGL